MPKLRLPLSDHADPAALKILGTVAAALVRRLAPQAPLPITLTISRAEFEANKGLMLGGRLDTDSQVVILSLEERDSAGEHSRQ